MIFIANFTYIFIFKDKLTSVQLPSFFYIDLEKESRNHTKTVVLLCSRIFVLEENATCSVNAVDLLEMSANCNIY